MEETLRAELQEVEARLVAKDEMLKRCQVCGGIVFCTCVRACGGAWACALTWHIQNERKNEVLAELAGNLAGAMVQCNLIPLYPLLLPLYLLLRWCRVI